MKEITLNGTFYEMGKQYGEGCKKNIKSFAKSVNILHGQLAKPLGSDHPQRRWF